jgi:signal transduction histidine kinase
MTEAGLIVDLEAGDPRRIPPGIALSAYRVAQEALTNVLRHAGAGARVRMVVTYETEALTLDIVDDGRGRRTATTEHGGVGHGLVGMRERVALFGGTLDAGPRPEGGFRVRARFPLDAGADLGLDLDLPRMEQ